MKLLKILKTIFSIIIAGFLFLLASALIISQFNFPGNIKIFSVQSGSMSPAIPVGSIVITRPQEQYNIGDIITFYAANPSQTVITHRIVREEMINNSQSFYTQGDANDVEDGRIINKDQIIGKVLSYIPLLGYPFTYAKTQVGFLLLIIIPSTLIIFTEVLNVKKEISYLIQKRRDKNLN